MSDTALNYFLAYGTHTQRVAFSPNPATPAAGPSPLYVWFETDTLTTWVYDGAWAPAAPGFSVSTTASGVTITPPGGATQYGITALATPTTIAAPAGSPVDGVKLVLRFKDNGTARSLTWNAIYRVVGVTLPTTTVVSKVLYVGCIYNAQDSVWDVVAVGQQA